MGSGPFKFVGYEIGQSIKGVRNPDYYHKGLPYLDGFIGIFADKQAVRVEAIRGDRAAIEFRGLPPSARDELVQELGDKITVQDERLELRQPDHAQPQEEAVRRRPGAPRADAGDRPLARRAGARQDRQRAAPSAASSSRARRWRRPRRSCEQLAGFWPDIEKSRAEAQAPAEGGGGRGAQLRAAEPQRRPALQISSAPG